MRTKMRTVKRPTTIQRIMSNSNCLVCTNTPHFSCFQGMANGLIRKNVVHKDGQSCVVLQHGGHIVHDVLNSGNRNAIHDGHFVRQEKLGLRITTRCGTHVVSQIIGFEVMEHGIALVVYDHSNTVSPHSQEHNSPGPQNKWSKYPLMTSDHPSVMTSIIVSMRSSASGEIYLGMRRTGEQRTFWTNSAGSTLTPRCSCRRCSKGGAVRKGATDPRAPSASSRANPMDSRPSLRSRFRTG